MVFRWEVADLDVGDAGAEPVPGVVGGRVVRGGQPVDAVVVADIEVADERVEDEASRRQVDQVAGDVRPALPASVVL